MSNIYKLNHIYNNETTHIYVFNGGLSYEGENYGPKGTKFFNTREWQNIKKKNIPVTIVPYFIHSDDSIFDVKKKIIKFLKIEKSINQLYLFGIVHKILNPVVLYDQLSQSGKIDITHDKFCHFLKNIIDISDGDVSDGDVSDGDVSGDGDVSDYHNTDNNCGNLIVDIKKTYNYDDFLSLNDFDWTEKKYLTIPIGQKLIIKDIYPFVSNPYNTNFMDEMIQSNIENIVTTQNNN